MVMIKRTDLLATGFWKFLKKFSLFPAPEKFYKIKLGLESFGTDVSLEGLWILIVWNRRDFFNLMPETFNLTTW